MKSWLSEEYPFELDDVFLFEFERDHVADPLLELVGMGELTQSHDHLQVDGNGFLVGLVDLRPWVVKRLQSRVSVVRVSGQQLADEILHF